MGLQNLTAPRAVLVVLRIVMAVGGGYAVASGLSALMAIALPRATSMPRSEAVVLAAMLAFLVYLSLLIWAFAEPRLARLCVIFIGAAIASWAGTCAIMRLAPGG